MDYTMHKGVRKMKLTTIYNKMDSLLDDLYERQCECKEKGERINLKRAIQNINNAMEEIERCLEGSD